MRVVYEWTQSEWDEAVRLATAKKRRGSGVSAITYGVILVPLLGGAITGLINLHQHHMVIVGATILPMLLGLIVLCLALWIAGAKWRMRRMRAADPMPTGECEAVLQEGGWRFCSLTATEEVAVAETAATSLMPWSSMTGTREGGRVMVFLHEAGFAGVPMRCLSEDQVGHVQRMMARKLRPQSIRR